MALAGTALNWASSTTTCQGRVVAEEPREDCNLKKRLSGWPQFSTCRGQTKHATWPAAPRFRKKVPVA
eukprot:7804772-Lingulodinium_polyedra.AAC.1